MNHRLAILFVSNFIMAYSLHAETIYVSSDARIKSIREAVHQSRPGDTIIVLPGIYREKTIEVDKPITLIGKEKPILDGENNYEIISVKSDHVTIEGFQLKNSGYSDLKELGAIKNYNRRFVVIRNNIFVNTVFGVYSQYATNCSIIGNQFFANAKEEIKSGNGIHCWRCDSMVIEGNIIEGHRDGIYFEFVTNSSIENNIARKNIRYGLHFMFSHHNFYLENSFINNGAGVAVMYSNHVTMLKNTFSENQGGASYGILMKEISDSRVEGNTFRHNTTGIYMEGTNRIDMTRNDFFGNGYAVKIQANCSDVEVTENNFISNTFDVTTNGSLVLNSFEANYWDKYEGYDLDRNGVGDVPYRPISLYSMIIEQVPEAMMLLHSFIVTLLDKMEKVIPSITPENLQDSEPRMKPVTT